MIDKTKARANMVCSKLLYGDVYMSKKYMSNDIFVRLDDGTGLDFNIFTNASQCLKVIETLGDTHDLVLSIRPNCGQWYVQSALSPDIFYKSAGTIPEAIAKAVMEIEL